MGIILMDTLCMAKEGKWIHKHMNMMWMDGLCIPQEGETDKKNRRKHRTNVVLIDCAWMK